MYNFTYTFANSALSIQEGRYYCAKLTTLYQNNPLIFQLQNG